MESACHNDFVTIHWSWAVRPTSVRTDQRHEWSNTFGKVYSVETNLA